MSASGRVSLQTSLETHRVSVSSAADLNCLVTTDFKVWPECGWDYSKPHLSWNSSRRLPTYPNHWSVALYLWSRAPSAPPPTDRDRRAVDSPRGPRGRPRTTWVRRGLRRQKQEFHLTAGPEVPLAAASLRLGDGKTRVPSPVADATSLRRFIDVLLPLRPTEALLP